MDMRDDIVIRPETPNADGRHADDSDIVMLAPVSVHADYLHKHIGTGIQYVVKNRAEGRGGMPLLRTQRDIEKYNELTQTYMDKYPNLVTSQGMAEMYASFEICGCMHRTETGIMKVFCDSISYNDNNDYKKNWAAKFDDATWDLLYEWLEEHQNRVNDFDKFQSWADILDEIGGTCERIWSDAEVKLQSI